jgi:hypothetical protein
MGLQSDYDRNRELDASVTRVRMQAQNAETGRACAIRLAQNFTSQEHRRRVYHILYDFTAIDDSASSEESKFLAVMRGVFQIG